MWGKRQPRRNIGDESHKETEDAGVTRVKMGRRRWLKMQLMSPVRSLFRSLYRSAAEGYKATR